MPTYDSGTSGLVGTIGVTILLLDGTVHVARATAGITEPVAGSGVYHIADHDATADLIYAWDNGVGTVGASEVLYAGRGNAASIAAILDDTGTTLPAAIAAASSKGSGDKQVRLTIKNTNGAIVADAEVTVTTDAAGDTVACGPVWTDALGKTPVQMLSAGTYYRWASKTGETFTNPQPFTVV